jgi:hypothetical protein
MIMLFLFCGFGVLGKEDWIVETFGVLRIGFV